MSAHTSYSQRKKQVQGRRKFLATVLGSVGGTAALYALLAAERTPPRRGPDAKKRRPGGYRPMLGAGKALKITKLETLMVKPRWLFLKVHTDAGIVGLGEPKEERRTQTVETALKQ